jgi:hypothetical protein
VFEDLNHEELKRRANERLPERVLATLEDRGEGRSVAGAVHARLASFRQAEAREPVTP